MKRGVPRSSEIFETEPTMCLVVGFVVVVVVFEGGGGRSSRGSNTFTVLQVQPRP